MVKIRVRTREGAQKMADEIERESIEKYGDGITDTEAQKIVRQKNIIDEELTSDIDPEDIVAIESEDYEIEDRFSADAYDEYLDEIYPTVSIGYNEYEASRILRELSPNDYQMGYGEWRTEQEQYIAEELVDIEHEGYPQRSTSYWENVLSNFPFPSWQRLKFG